MNYKKYVEKINAELSGYKSVIDTLGNAYKSEFGKVKNEAESMRGKWTSEYITEYIDKEKATIGARYKAKAIEEKAKHEPIVIHYLELIEKQLKNYFMTPANADFLNKINSIKITGLQLSNQEFQILKQSARSYMECRLLNELAKTRTKEEYGITEKGEYGAKEVKNPYFSLEVPDIDIVMNGFEQYKNSVMRVVNSYCGTNAELHECLGVSTPKHLCITAESYFRNGSRENFESIMENANSILPEAKVKRDLTENEKKLIDILVNPDYPSLAEGKIKEISEHSPELRQLFSLDNRYSKIIEKIEE